MTLCRYTYKWQFRMVKAMAGFTVLMAAVGFCIGFFLPLVAGKTESQDVFLLLSYWQVILSGASSVASILLIPAYFIACYKSHSRCFIIEEVPNKLLLISNYLLLVAVMGFCVSLLILWNYGWPYVFPDIVQPVHIICLPCFIHLAVFKRPLPDSWMLYTFYAVAGCCAFLSAFQMAVRFVSLQIITGDNFNGYFSKLYALFYALTVVQLSVVVFRTSHNTLTKLQDVMQCDKDNATQTLSRQTFGCRQQWKNALRMMRKHWIASLLSVKIILITIFSIFFPALIFWPIPMAMISIFYWMKLGTRKQVGVIGWGTDRIIIVAGCSCEIAWSIYVLTEMVYNGYVMMHLNNFLISMGWLTGTIQAISQCIIATEILHRQMDIRNIRNPLAQNDDAIDRSARERSENQWSELFAPCLLLCLVNAYFFISNSLLPVPYFDDIRATLCLTFFPMRLMFRWHAMTYFINVFLNATNWSREHHAELVAV